MNENIKQLQILRKTSERFPTLPNVSERVPRHPSRSEQVPAIPSTSPNLWKLQKPCENIEKPGEDAKNLRENFDEKYSIVFEKLFDDFFFAESIRMYPNVSECVKTDPNRPENVEKLRENVEKPKNKFHSAVIIDRSDR